MKVACISDMHGHLVNIEPCDLLLIAGDICGHAPRENVGSFMDKLYQLKWLNTWFREWLDLIPAKQVVATPGNHDFIFQAMELIPPDLRWHVLMDEVKTVSDKKIYGSPWQHWFYDWAFNAPRRNNGGEEFLERKFSSIPGDTDIFVVHGPPYGYGDAVPRNDKTVEFTGSTSLTAAIKRVRPQISVHGHIHMGRGDYRCFFDEKPAIEDRKHKEVKIVNASICNEENHPIHEAMYFDIE